MPFTGVPAGSTFLLSKTVIQLQLQEMAESKSKSGRAPGAPAFEMSCLPVIAVLIAAVLGLGFNSAYGRRLGDQAHAAATKREDNPDSFRRRMHVIKQLSNRQTAAPDFLNDISASGEDSSAVWFKTITDEGKSIAIEGMASSPNALSKIISDLKSTGYFRNIEIQETYRDDSKNKTHTFEFQLTCEFETAGS